MLIFMQIYIKLYLESIVRGTFDLVRKIMAGFPKEVLMGQKSELAIGVVGSKVMCCAITFLSVTDCIYNSGVPGNLGVW